MRPLSIATALLLLPLLLCGVGSAQPPASRTSFRATGLQRRHDGSSGPLTKVQERRALAEHDRIVRRVQKHAIKSSPPIEKAYSADPGTGHCAASFRRALRQYQAALSPAAEVVLPQDKAAYAAAKRLKQISNIMFNDNKPAAVVYLGTEADAVVVTTMAEASGCRICGRSGGHDTAGASVCPGGIVADVSRLKGIQVDVGQGVAWFQAGLHWQEVIDATEPLGVSCITGLCPTVSVSGFTLGGGWGALSKKYGFGTDNVLSYTVAIPDAAPAKQWGDKTGAGGDAQLVVANATGPYSDLFFALRGAGHSSFGLVTSMTYRVFPLTNVSIAQVVFPNLAANPALGAQALYLWQQQYLNRQPMELAIFPNLGDNQDTGTFDLAFAAMYGSSAPGTEAALVAALQPLVDLGGQLAWVRTVPYSEGKGYSDNIAPPPLQDDSTDPTVYWELKMGQYCQRPLSVGEFRAIVDGALSLPVQRQKGGEQTRFYRLVYLEGTEGAMTTPAPTDTAFVHRSVGFDLVVDVFAPPAVKGALTAAADWLMDLYQRRWAGFVGPAAYQNYPSVLYQPLRVALEQYYGANLCRLVAIKLKYDPQQVFGWRDSGKTGSNESGNQGIPPSLPGC